MMFKKKLSEISNAYSALVEISQKEVSAELAFKISSILLDLLPVYQSIEAARKKILEKHSKKNNSGQLSTASTGMEDAQAEFSKFLEKEEEIEIKTIDKKYFDGINIRPIILVNISWLIE